MKHQRQYHQRQRRGRGRPSSFSLSLVIIMWTFIIDLLLLLPDSKAGMGIDMDMNMIMNKFMCQSDNTISSANKVSASSTSSTAFVFAFHQTIPSFSTQHRRHRKQQFGLSSSSSFTFLSSSLHATSSGQDNPNRQNDKNDYNNEAFTLPSAESLSAESLSASLSVSAESLSVSAESLSASMGNRRTFLMMMASTAIASTQSASAANANVNADTNINFDTLENIGIGKGTWRNQNENNYNDDIGSASASAIDTGDGTSTTSTILPIPLPTSFITYMTRFLINYDTSIHSWWYDDISYKYSLLTSTSTSTSTSFDDDGPLTSNFASMAKSIEFSLMEYISTVGSDSRSSLNTNTNGNTEKVGSIQNRFESLLSLFVTTYVPDAKVRTNSNTNTINNNVLVGVQLGTEEKENESASSTVEVIQQIVLLFTMLPSQYQPTRGLNTLTSALSISSGSSTRNNSGKDTSTLEYNTDLTKLLPTDIYSTTYDPSKEVYTIYPSIDEVGCNSNILERQQIVTSDQNTSPNDNNNNNINIYNTPYQSTSIFGPISNKPLKRQRPNLSFDTYALLGLCGAAGCALTHTVVIPFDVVKTRLQTNPDQYKNLIDGVISISQEDDSSTIGGGGSSGTGGGGWKTFLLGSQATIAGYFWYGLSVYPCYSFSKWYMEHNVFSPPAAVVYASLISLIAGAIAAVVASIGLTPIEAARIRTVAEPGIYRELGLVGTLRYMAAEGEELGVEGKGGGGFKTLYAGFPSLVTRQVIFGSVKFLAFERACEALFATFPSLQETTATALGVSLVAGALSGALSSVISQPADSILTYVAKNKAGNTSVGVFDGGMLMVEREGLGSLYRGLGSRCLWASAIISGQFFLYDIFRNLLGINAEDLMQVFRLLLSSE